MPQPQALARASLVAALLLGLLGAAVVPSLLPAHAASSRPAVPAALCSQPVLAQWTFSADSLIPTTGVGTLTMQPASPGPVTPFPPGQVASENPSLGLTNWPVAPAADPLVYIELEVATTGSNSVQLAFDYQSDSNGPTRLDVSYSVDAGATYTSLVTGDPLATSAWTHLAFDLSAISAVEDKPDVRFRLQAYSATTAAGMLSLDNVTLSHACFTPTPTNTPTPVPGSIVISEVRFIGSSGATDEFVELFNRSCSTTYDLNGWIVAYSDGAGNPGQLLHQFSGSTPLPPGHFFLLGGSGYSWTTQQAVPDVTFGPDIPNDGGVALIYPDTTTIIDQVGLSPGSTYKEGTPLQALNNPLDQGYLRRSLASGIQDSSNNSADFSQLPSDPRNSTQTGPCGVPQTPTPSPTRTPIGFHPRVIINEVGWAGTGFDRADQWIELYNPGPQDQDLTGWSLEGTNFVVNLRGTLAAQHFYLLVHGDTANATQAATSTPTLPPASAPNACFVFYRTDVEIAQVFSDSLSINGQALLLINNTNGVEDSADRNNRPWPAGSYTPIKSMERSGPTVLTDTTVGAWFTFEGDPVALNTARDCDGNHVHGTPGKANWAYTVTVTPSPTLVPFKFKTATPRPPTPFAHMVLNEFLPRSGTDWNGDGAVDTFDEFIELKNLGPIDVNLQGWKIDVLAAGPATSFTLPSQTLKTGERALFYGSTDRLLLVDSGATVRLFNNRGVLIDARTYGPVSAPDVSHCRIPDGYYWQDACFPTPGRENSLTGSSPAPPPIAAFKPPPCLLADTVPQPFRDAECFPYGADIFNRAIWDDQAGHSQFPVHDVYSKWRSRVQ